MPAILATTSIIALAVAISTRTRDPYALLKIATANSSRRMVEARLTGFPWKPMQARHEAAKQMNASTASYRLAEATQRAIRGGEEIPAKDSAQAAGIAYLLTGRTANAVATLSQGLMKGAGSASLWNDLAAAKYTLGLEENSVEPLIGALVATDSAIRADDTLAEAYFNRALILEAIGLRDLATAAWRRYLEIDQSSGWATEARAHERETSRPAPQFADELNRVYDVIATDPAAADDLARRFPQEVRTWGETEILARWAEAEETQASSASKHLAIARAFGQRVAERGDTLLLNAVISAERASKEQKHVLALAHLDFRDAQRLFKDMKPAAAEAVFARAEEMFERGHSPVALLARYFRANTAYEQGRIEEARAALEQLHAAAPMDFRSYRAQLEWELALCYWAKVQWGQTIDSFTAAMRTFDQLDEKAHAAAMRHMLAGVYDATGDAVTAWNLRTAGLRQLGQVNSNRLQAALGSLATAAILRREWPAALSVLNLELEAAQASKNVVFTADALLRRALVLQRMGDRPGAHAASVEAWSQTQRIDDVAVRAQYEERLLWVDGTIAESPAERVATLTRAIAFHEKSGRRMLLPSILYDRAQAYRAEGDQTRAAEDLEAAVAELERTRETLKGAERRWGIFNSSQDIFDAAIQLAQEQRDVERAFRYADRARATTLLDALKAPIDSPAPAVPAGTCIVEYYSTAFELHLFVVSQSGIQHRTQAVIRDSLAADIAQVQRELSEGNRGTATNLLRKLDELLWQPIASSVSAADTIVFVPDATTSGVPFAALAGRDGTFLIEEHPIVVSPSAAYYMRTASSDDRVDPSRLLTVVSGDVRGWERLPDAPREAAAIRSLYPNAASLEGPFATPAAFDREARRATIIHFSGHALASEITAEDTFLLLSNANGGQENFDVRRIAAMQLQRSPIVVLAACSTARGRVTPFEGTQSAARAFLGAGAANVIATLWPVGDEDAAAFYALFHKRLAAGDKPDKALQFAQVQSIRSSAPLSMWAAVQSIGR